MKKVKSAFSIETKTSKPGPILKSNAMGSMFQKKDKEMLKKEKIFENLDKNAQNFKIVWKRAGHCMQ